MSKNLSLIKPRRNQVEPPQPVTTDPEAMLLRQFVTLGTLIKILLFLGTLLILLPQKFGPVSLGMR